MNEDAQISSYIKGVVEKIEDTEDKIVNSIYAIDDTKENWDHEMKGINDRLYKNAVANGITKERFKFLVLNIKDMDDEFV